MAYLFDCLRPIKGVPYLRCAGRTIDVIHRAKQLDKRIASHRGVQRLSESAGEHVADFLHCLNVAIKPGIKVPPANLNGDKLTDH
jgi:hypothetical protein